MHPLVNVAITAARKAGAIILRGAEKRGELVIAAKQANDFVTEIDRKAELAIIQIIQQSYPDHDILGEESGAVTAKEGTASEVQWIIDPLDGTTNFIHGFPQFAVSIGIRVRGRLEHGVIYDPLKNELFTASRGRGAQLDGKRLRMPRRPSLDGALLGTGMPFRQDQDVDAYMAMLKRVMTQCAGIRRAGSAALDLAYVASGRLDGFWELGLKPWDIAAGAVLVQEAGGIIGGINGEPEFMTDGNVIAGSPKVFAALVRELKLAG